MKKKCFSLLMAASLFLLCACGTGANLSAQSAAGSVVDNSKEASKTVEPLDSALNIDALDDCTFAASFEASDVGLNDDGALVIKMTAWDYECFDMVDIAELAVGDKLVIDGDTVTVESVKRDGSYVVVNGGLEEGGFDLYTDENGVYYETMMDAGPNYYSLGEITLPVDQDFIYTDSSDLEKEPQKYYAGDFITNMENSDESFAPNATTVRVAGGKVVELTKIYMP